jgi:hypothetical protein
MDTVHNELQKAIDKKILEATTVLVAYRGLAGSLICVLAVTSNGFEILTFNRDGLANSIYDFNWFWNEITKIPRLGKLSVSAIKPSIGTTPFVKVVQDPYVAGVLTAIIWAIVNYATEDMFKSSVVALVILLLYGVVLYIRELRRKVIK